MTSFYFNYRWLSWSRPCEKTVPPAPGLGLRRHWVETLSGNIEVLYNQPTGASPELRTPIFFIHGGMGGAWVWAEYMQFFAAQGIPCYAVSLRGHGNSWHPSYLRMVYFTPRRALEEDAMAAIKWVQEREGDNDLLLVGHSSGGGISQSLLSQARLRVKGLALLGAIPNYGSAGVFKNWAALDPWCIIRMIFQGGHPNSPLSHPALTKQAFFSGGASDAKVLDFQSRMSRYESFLWPLSMMRPFADADKVVESICGWGGDTGNERTARILVMTGTDDRLTTPNVMIQLATAYRTVLAQLVGTKKVDLEDDHRSIEASAEDESGGEGRDERHGVWLTFVPGAGHHLQNDVPWEIGANKLLKFYERLSCTNVDVEG